MEKHTITIGRREYVSFPQFNVHNVVAKIDTGAYSGCIHARVLGEIERDEQRVLQFTLLDTTHPELADTIFETKTYRVKRVKNASGVVQHRYVITTPIVIAGVTLEVEIGLSDRASMKNPVLIGRKILADNFTVDVAGEFLASPKN